MKRKTEYRDGRRKKTITDEVYRNCECSEIGMHGMTYGITMDIVQNSTTNSSSIVGVSFILVLNMLGLFGICWCGCFRQPIHRKSLEIWCGNRANRIEPKSLRMFIANSKYNQTKVTIITDKPKTIVIENHQQTSYLLLRQFCCGCYLGRLYTRNRLSVVGVDEQSNG